MRIIKNLYIEGNKEVMDEIFRKIRDKLGRGINVVEINTNYAKEVQDE